MDNSGLFITGIVIIILTIRIFSGIFVDQSIAVEYLEKQGFTGIKIIDEEWLFVWLRGCTDGDAAKFTANATNSQNQTVQVYVCVGMPYKKPPQMSIWSNRGMFSDIISLD